MLELVVHIFTWVKVCAFEVPLCPCRERVKETFGWKEFENKVVQNERAGQRRLFFIAPCAVHKLWNILPCRVL